MSSRAIHRLAPGRQPHVVIDHRWLAALVARATPLAQRFGQPPSEADPAVVGARLKRWSQTVARGDAERFARRLALDGLDLDAAAAAVADPPPVERLPPWALLVADALERCAAPVAAQRPDGGAAVALEDLTLPFAQAARERLIARVGARADVDGAVLETLARELLVQLGSLASSTLDLDLRRWRRQRLDPLEEALLRAGGDPPRERYDAWVAELRVGRLADVLGAHAVLARQLGTQALGWVAATAELVEHVEADRCALVDTFNDGRPLGALVGVGGVASDPHRGGRRVVGCRFACGLEIVYKPKSLRSEAVWAQLLGWLNDHGADPPLRALRVLERTDHGWVELARQQPVQEVEQVGAFYRRAGTLLALLHAIGAKDCHAENLVAAGDQPVLVDAETVLHPVLAAVDALPGAAPDALHLAGDRFVDSVLGVGLLPDWMIGSDGRAFDISGLGAVEAQEGLEGVATWEHANTDVARLALRPAQVGPFANVLRRDGVAQRPEDHVDDLCGGFADAYRILREHRDELVAAHGPLAALEQAPVRVLFRATQVYYRTATVAQQPAALTDGAAFSIELELLGRPLLDSPAPDAFWELHRREQAQLEDTDIPYFAVPGDATALRDAAGRPLVGFRASALDNARRRLSELGDEDQRLQLSILRAALATRVVPAAGGSSPADEVALAEPADRPRTALDAAVALAEELEATAIRSGDGVAWVGLALGDEAERWTLRPSAYDLYGGAPGIAVMLAALARQTGEDRWRSLALSALAPTLQQAESDPGRLAVLRGIGGSVGVGGMIYALALVAELLDAERPLAAARALALALPPAVLEQDAQLDVMAGAAGALAGLLTLERVGGEDPGVLALARTAGAALMRAADRDGDATPLWATSAGRRLDGFSHGTSGIALMLARLGARTGDAAALALAGRAVAGESARYDDTLAGWPDRRVDQAHTSTSWCHGSAGIGLARLELMGTPLGETHAEELGRDVARARRAVLDAARDHDHLCCGAAGEIEFLLQLPDDEARAGAHDRADRLAARILAGRPPRLNRPGDDDRAVPSPGLFQGTAGIALSLLRRVDPGLTCVLSWR